MDARSLSPGCASGGWREAQSRRRWEGTPFPRQTLGFPRARGTAHTRNAGGEWSSQTHQAALCCLPPHTLDTSQALPGCRTLSRPPSGHTSSALGRVGRTAARNELCEVPGHRPDRCPGEPPTLQGPVRLLWALSRLSLLLGHPRTPALPSPPVSTQQPCPAPHCGSLRTPPPPSLGMQLWPRPEFHLHFAQRGRARMQVPGHLRLS